MTFVSLEAISSIYTKYLFNKINTQHNWNYTALNLPGKGYNHSIYSVLFLSSFKKVLWNFNHFLEEFSTTSCPKNVSYATKN